MEAQITQESPILVKAKVSVPWEKLSEHHHQALKTLRSNANIPGFRPGKSPLALLKKRYKPAILSELIQKVVPESLAQVAEDHKLRMVGTPRLGHCDYAENDGLHYEAEFDIIADFEVQDWKNSELESLNVSVSDDQLEHELGHRIDHASVVEDVSEGGAQDGHTVTLSITAIDVATDASVFDQENYKLELGSESSHPVLSAAVKGASAGDTVIEEFEAADDDELVELRGLKVKTYMDISQVQHKVIPALDDAFAKTQDFDSLADMKTKLGEDLLKRAEAEEKNRLTNILLTNLEQQYDFEVPDAIIKEQAKFLVRRQLMQYGGGIADGLDDSMLESLAQSMMPQALSMARLDLILPKLGEEMELKVTDEDIDGELKGYAEQAGKSIADLRVEYEKEGILSGLEVQVLKGKVIDNLIEAAKITKVDALTVIEPPEQAGQDEEAAAQDQPEAAEAVSQEDSE